MTYEPRLLSSSRWDEALQWGQGRIIVRPFQRKSSNKVSGRSWSTSRRICARALATRPRGAFPYMTPSGRARSNAAYAHCLRKRRTRPCRSQGDNGNEFCSVVSGWRMASTANTGMVWLFIGAASGAALVVLFALFSMRRRSEARPADLGTVSKAWLAQRRADVYDVNR